MLILTRKPNQGFYITEDIYICITRINGDQVSIGINAPEAMSIWREELLKKAGVPPITADDDDSLNQQKEYSRLQMQLERQRACYLFV